MPLTIKPIQKLKKILSLLHTLYLAKSVLQALIGVISAMRRQPVNIANNF